MQCYLKNKSVHLKNFFLNVATEVCNLFNDGIRLILLIYAMVYIYILQYIDVKSYLIFYNPYKFCQRNATAIAPNDYNCK